MKNALRFVWLFLVLVLSSCGAERDVDGDVGVSDRGASDMGASDMGPRDGGRVDLIEPTDDLPAAGHDGGCAVPEGAQPEDTSSPDRVVGDGTTASCTGEAFIEAVAQGGVITFDCGPDPITIALDGPAKIVNDTGPEIVIDGGGLVTLDGQGQSRILYMNTCDQAQVWTTAMCQNQDHPQLAVQNLTFISGDATGEMEEGGGGGAIFVSNDRSGSLIIEDSTLRDNSSDGFETEGFPGIFVLASEPPRVTNSTLE